MAKEIIEQQQLDLKIIKKRIEILKLREYNILQNISVERLKECCVVGLFSKTRWNCCIWRHREGKIRYYFSIPFHQLSWEVQAKTQQLMDDTLGYNEKLGGNFVVIHEKGIDQFRIMTKELLNTLNFSDKYQIKIEKIEVIRQDRISEIKQDHILIHICEKRKGLVYLTNIPSKCYTCRQCGFRKEEVTQMEG